MVIGIGIGLILGVLLGMWIGGALARHRRLRQLQAALKEGRVQVADNLGKALRADDFALILDDEFRDA